MINVLVFGVAAELIGGRKLELPAGIDSVGELRAFLFQRYPRLRGLNSLMIAVNREYAEDCQSISGRDEVALIPPVSGG